jgi:hypothetical protein
MNLAGSGPWSGSLPNSTNSGRTRSLVLDWTQLTIGDRVVIVDPRRQRYPGTVDELSYDGSMLWLVQDHGAGRRLFLNSDVHLMLLDPSKPELGRESR